MTRPPAHPLGPMRDEDDDPDLKLALALSLMEANQKKSIPGEMQPPSPPVLPQIVHALYDFDGRQEDELSFKAGDQIQLLDASHPDWWRGVLYGRTGLFPSIYVSRSGPGGTGGAVGAAGTAVQASAGAAATSPVIVAPSLPFDPKAIDDFITILHRQKANKAGLTLETATSHDMQAAYQNALVQKPRLLLYVRQLQEHQTELENLDTMYKEAMATYNSLVGRVEGLDGPGPAGDPRHEGRVLPIVTSNSPPMP